MEDLIKREDVLKELCLDHKDVIYIDKTECARRIKAIPSADRPSGEWIVNMPNYKSICSVCGAKETEFIYGTEMWYGLGESNFCPHCGARMKGADDETD